MRTLGTIAALACVYFVTGRIGLIFAVEPGYATAVWPPSGIALAWTLIYGYRALPGVALGSLLVNANVANTAALTACGIGCGAALQAGIGALLVRRYVGTPIALDRGRDVAIFLILGGPIGSLVNSVWGVTWLYIRGGLGAEGVLLSWFTWWVGDTIGVLTVAPLVLAFLAEPRDLWRRRRLPLALPLAVTFGLAALLFHRVSAWERQEVQLELQERARELADELHRQFEQHLAAVDGIGDLYESSSVVDDETFFGMVSRSVERNPGLRGIGWAPRVARESREHFEKKTGLLIWQYDLAGNRIPAVEREQYFPLYLLEPEIGNEIALGFDLASEPARLAALKASVEAGDPVMSSTVALVQESSRRDGIIIPRAILRDGVLCGYISAALQIEEIVRPLLEREEHDGIRVMLGDARDDLAAGAGVLTATSTLEAAGRLWTLQISATESYVASRVGWQTWGALVTALLFSGLLGAFNLIVTGRAANIEMVVSERTRQLAEEVLLRREREAQLRGFLVEKELLIKEVHHRVKNNLQVISSLLNLQAARLRDKSVLGPFRESQERIRAMSLVHEQLYRSPDLSRVDLAQYARALLHNLQSSHGSGEKGISVRTDIEEIWVPVDTAIPSGLILHELFSNALKHAFPPPRTGTVKVQMTTENNEIHLVVDDDGVGLPRGCVAERSISFGFGLVEVLVEQLKGSMDVKSAPGKGTEITIRFRSERLN